MKNTHRHMSLGSNIFWSVSLATCVTNKTCPVAERVCWSQVYPSKPFSKFRRSALAHFRCTGPTVIPGELITVIFNDNNPEYQESLNPVYCEINLRWQMITTLIFFMVILYVLMPHTKRLTEYYVLVLWHVLTLKSQGVLIRFCGLICGVCWTL